MRYIAVGCLLCMVVLSACRGQFFPEARNPSEYKLISVVGLDRSEKTKEDVALTLSAKEQSDSKLGGGQSGGGGQAGDRPLLLTNEARSAARAYNEMQSYTQDYLFLGHVRYFLIGEQAARGGIERYLDFLRRDPDSRYLARLYVVEEKTAREMMTKASTNANYIADRLNAMEADVGVLSSSHALNLAQVAGKLEGSHGHMLLPLIRMTSPSDHDAAVAPQKGKNDGKPEDKEAAPEGPDGMTMEMDIAGYAIVINGRMAGTIGPGLSPAVNFLQNTVNSQIVEVKAGDGQTAALRVLSSRSRVKPHWDGDGLAGLDIVVHIEAALNENQSDLAVTSAGKARPLAGQLEDWAETRIADVLSQAQRLGVDYLGLGDRIGKKHPIRFDRLADDWDHVFSELPIAVQADASIIRTYEINS